VFNAYGTRGGQNKLIQTLVGQTQGKSPPGRPRDWWNGAIKLIF